MSAIVTPYSYLDKDGLEYILKNIKHNIDIEEQRATDEEAKLAESINIILGYVGDGGTILDVIKENVSVETERALNEEADIRAALAREIARAKSVEAALDRAIQTESTRADIEENTIKAALQSEIDRAITIEEKLHGALMVLYGGPLVEGSVQHVVTNAITALIAGAPEKLDTLKEIADYIASDTENVAQIFSKLANLETRADEQKNQQIADTTDLQKSIDDLRRVVALLEADTDAELQPTPTYDDVERLVVRMNAAESNVTELQELHVSDTQNLAALIARYDAELAAAKDEINSLKTRLAALEG